MVLNEISIFDIGVSNEWSAFFFLGFNFPHPYHSSQEDIYELHMIDELKRHVYHIKSWYFIPILHSLQIEGFLSRELRMLRVNKKILLYNS
jgi:hypothetical protein